MSQAVVLTKEKVQRFLTEWLGSIEIDRDGDFTIVHGSARLFINVMPFGDDESVVNVFAITNHHVPPSLEFYKYIAMSNYIWGHLEAFDADGDTQVRFRHSLLGEFLDPAELQMAVLAVAASADEADDAIQQKFGGKRFHDT